MAYRLLWIREWEIIDVRRIWRLWIERVPRDESLPADDALPDGLVTFPAQQGVLPERRMAVLFEHRQFLTAIDALSLFFIID